MSPGQGWPRQRREVDPVRVWYYRLDKSADLTAAWQVLDGNERARAERFRFETDRRRYIIAHFSVRTLLARCLELKPEQLRFTFSEAGKPRLENVAAGGLQFNTSDSGDLGMLALRRGGPLGVDVERVRDVAGLADVARRYFAAPERAWVETFRGPQTYQAFYRVWTCKEAYLKARGIGLGADLEGFAFDFAAPDRPGLRYCEVEGDDISDWEFESFAPVHGYRACIAGKALGAIRSVRAFDPFA